MQSHSGLANAVPAAMTKTVSGVRLAALLSLVLLAAPPGVAPAQAPGDSTPKKVSVSAQKPWVDTDVDLKAGEELTIRASATDKWTNGGHPPYFAGADGFAGVRYDKATLKSVNFIALIGKVGDQVFLVGKEYKGPSPATGRLYLQINDEPDASAFTDNDGKMDVEIERHVVGPPPLITNSLGMKFTLIKAGEFSMGSPDTDKGADPDEKPQHRVRITRPFYLGIHEVTRGQFRRFVDDSGYQTEAEKDGKGGWGWNEAAKNFEQNPRYTWLNPGFDQTDEHPVVNVSGNDAVAFAEWLSRKDGVTYRLPTEAEWEYACRAGTTTKYCSGDDPEGLAAVANIADGTAKTKYPNWPAIAAQDGFIYTAPVGRYNPNAWGLFDMHGNVWEWCSGGYAADYYKRSPVDDPPGPDGASSRVRRGGCWNLEPRSARSAYRDGSVPEYRNNDLGFRLARVQSVR